MWVCRSTSSICAPSYCLTAIIAGILSHEERKPNGMLSTGRIIGNVALHRESVTRQELLVFSRVEARVVERLATVGAKGLAGRRAAGEHERCTLPCVGGKAGEHGPLIARLQMEKAVPGEEAVEAAIQRQVPHVGDDPLALSKAGAGHRNQ